MKLTDLHGVRTIYHILGQMDSINLTSCIIHWNSVLSRERYYITKSTIQLVMTTVACKVLSHYALNHDEVVHSFITCYWLQQPTRT